MYQISVLNKVSKAFVLLSLPLQVGLLNLVATRPDWVERWYSGFLYKHIGLGLRIAFGGFSFPVGQFVFYGLIIAVLAWLTFTVKQLFSKRVAKKQVLLRFGFRLVAFLSGFYFLFNLLWGLNYYRK